MADIKITSQEELVNIISEIFLNKTDKVSKVSDDSVLRGFFGGIAKTGQKALKDIAIQNAFIYADKATGSQLDEIASDRGVAARFTASGSSVYVRIAANPGTEYVAGVHTFTGNHGVVFDLEKNVLVNEFGYAFAKVRSKQIGALSNVEALSVVRVSPVPTGHIYVINDFRATGGRDLEQDDVFRNRIKEGANILAKGTIAMLEQVFMKVNTNVLRVIHQGHNNLGQIVLAVVAQNGIDFTEAELSAMLENAQEFLSLTELRAFNHKNIGVKLVNIQYHPIDIDFRCEFTGSPDDVRREAQIRLAKYLDFRFWQGGKVEWDDLLQIIKQVKNMKYVPDTYFNPSSDIQISRGKLPRIRSFVLRDMSGNVVRNIANTLNPVYFQGIADESFQRTVLKNI